MISPSRCGEWTLSDCNLVMAIHCGKSMVPKTPNDIKLIHLGKFLENNKTQSESVVRDGAFAGGVITMHDVVQPVIAKKNSGGVITMHVVVQPVIAKKNSAKKQDDIGKLNSCGCTIL